MTKNNRKNKATGRLALILRCIAILAAFVTVVITAMALTGCELVYDPDVEGGDFKLMIKVSINVDENSNFRVLSENPVVIEAGTDAVFQVEINDGYKLSCLSEQYEYDAETGTVTFKNIRFPKTLDVTAIEKMMYSFDLSCDSKKGSISSSVKSGGVYEEGTVIKITTIPKSDEMFVGYSSGALVKYGGVPIFYSNIYEFTLTQDMKIFANFATEGSKMIVYNGNGGTVTGSKSDIIYTETIQDFYLCPNTLPEQGNFEREGYVLYGYNTEADGSGTFYGCGWNVVMPETNLQTLYCMWAKETDASKFKYSLLNDGSGVKYAMIEKYTGNDENVVIPLTLEGCEVRIIKNNAFDSQKIKSVTFNRNIRAIMDGAFNGCSSLETIYMFDRVETITDESFKYCPNLQKGYFLACVAPRHTNPLKDDPASGSFSIKYERLITIKEPMLVLVSGSSSTWGLNSFMLEEGLKGKYKVVNYGNNAYTTSIFYLEFISNFVDEDDVVLLAPEPISTQLGDNNASRIELWQIMESAYDAFQYIDLRNYEGLFNSFGAYNRNRLPKPEQSYESHSPNVNTHGDYIKPRSGKAPDYRAQVVDRFTTAYLTEENAARLNKQLDAIAAKGAKVWITFSPYNENGLAENSKLKSTQTTYENTIRKLYHGEVISTIEENLFPGNYFSTNDLHMSLEGADERTRVLINTLMRKINSTK